MQAVKSRSGHCTEVQLALLAPSSACVMTKRTGI